MMNELIATLNPNTEAGKYKLEFLVNLVKETFPNFKLDVVYLLGRGNPNKSKYKKSDKILPEDAQKAKVYFVMKTDAEILEGTYETI